MPLISVAWLQLCRFHTRFSPPLLQNEPWNGCCWKDSKLLSNYCFYSISHLSFCQHIVVDFTWSRQPWMRHLKANWWSLSSQTMPMLILVGTFNSETLELKKKTIGWIFNLWNDGRRNVNSRPTPLSFPTIHYQHLITIFHHFKGCQGSWISHVISHMYKTLSWKGQYSFQRYVFLWWENHFKELF